MLSTLAFDPSQPRDEQGQWTSGGFKRVSATDAAGSGLNSEWSAAHGEADGPFWNVTGEKNARYWTIRDDSGKLVAGVTTISRGLMTEVKAIGSHAQGQGQKLLDEIKAKNVWVVALAVPTAISFFTKNGFQKTDEAPGDYNVKWRRPAVRALSFPLAPAHGARLLLLAAMRAGAFNPDQPRDDQGQWTDGGMVHNSKLLDKAKLQFHSISVGERGLDSVELVLYPGVETKTWKGIDNLIAVDWSTLPAGVSKENIVGSVKIYRHGDTLVGSSLQVEEDYRRQGIATALYDKIETVRGLLTPEFKSTDAGAAFWRSRRLRSASRSVSPLHAAADAHLAKLSVAIRYAFAMGRKALGKGDASKAAKAVRTALLSVLPGTLLKVVVAGGEAGVAVLQKQLKTLGAPDLRTAKPRDKALRMRFDASNPRAVVWAKQHAAELAKDLSETTEQAIKDAVARAQEEGDADQLRNDILDAVGDEARAELIARTETMRAANFGQREAWDQAVDEGLLPADVKRTWIITPDEKVCPICEPLDGTIADLHGEYADGISGPPAHVQCRCTEGITS